MKAKQATIMLNDILNNKSLTNEELFTPCNKEIEKIFKSLECNSEVRYFYSKFNYKYPLNKKPETQQRASLLTKKYVLALSELFTSKFRIERKQPVGLIYFLIPNNIYRDDIFLSTIVFTLDIKIKDEILNIDIFDILKLPFSQAGLRSLGNSPEDLSPEILNVASNYCDMKIRAAKDIVRALRLLTVE